MVGNWWCSNPALVLWFIQPLKAISCLQSWGYNNTKYPVGAKYFWGKDRKRDFKSVGGKREKLGIGKTAFLGYEIYNI